MFTGIIEEVGEVHRKASSLLTVRTLLTGIGVGNSITVNGTCLTVKRSVKSDRAVILSFDVSPETQQRTNLGELEPGSKVNLERALRMGDRFGGHIMTGHVEDTARLVQKKSVRDSWEFTFAFDRRLRQYVVSKGSVGVDGISLTVAGCGSDFFTVAVIPHTMKNTNLGLRNLGDKVNLEPDILAKYTESVLIQSSSKVKTTKDILREYGFIN